MKRNVLVLAAIAAPLVLSTPSQAMNCVAYVRSVTGFDLSGNAWQWWNSADGVYSRGHQPVPGAVMVFSRTSEMSHGHVAVVREVRGSREILIDQANWVQGRHHRGLVSKAVSVIDVSPDNDWTEVRVEWMRSGDYGRVNPVQGFIYSDGDSRAVVTSARYLTERVKTGHHAVQCATTRRHKHGHHVLHEIVARHHRKGHQAEIVPASLHSAGHHHAHIVHTSLQQHRHHGHVATPVAAHAVTTHHVLKAHHVVVSHHGAAHVVKASTRHHHAHIVETQATSAGAR
jgi:surface antigen